MSFRNLIKSAARRVARVAGFAAQAPAAEPTFAPLDPSIALRNQEALAHAILTEPRILRRYEAQALLLMGAHGGRSRIMARTALLLAAGAAGRHIGPAPTLEPRLRKASLKRLAFWATDRGTPV